MIAPNPNSLCKEAELYYYDFLREESRGLVPESIINHIEQCQHCQEQINRLKKVLSEVEGHVGAGQRQLSSTITEMLELHFAYIGKRVTCETVKPFLPSLLDPALEIRIPTPITAHLDNCQQCSEDLETIRRLNLNRKQLCRLSQLFAEKPGEDNISCSQAQAAILAVVTMAFRETNTEVLKHLSICPDCRKVLYQYRETVREGMVTNKRVPEKFPCEEVSETDIFNYVMPYGLDPANDQYAKFRESLTSHMRSCPTCLAKMQQLHNTVYGIGERAESQVVTIYHVDESAKARVVSEPDDLYAGFPIRVEIANREEEVGAGLSASTIDFGAVLKQKVSAMNLKPLVKTVAVVAAAILIATALLLNIPTAKAVTIDKIYKALEKVKNVHIASFVPGQAEPVQEQWVSRTLNINIIKTQNEFVLWDIPNRSRKVKHLGTDLIETTSLTDDIIAGVEGKMSGSLGLMPFYDISEIPKDAQWNRITDDISEATARRTEVYDLTWVKKAYNGSAVFQKCRFFVHPGTNLPQKTKFYEKSSADSEYVLRSVNVVEHLSDSEMQKVIKEISF